VSTSRRQTAGIKFVLLIVLAFGLCMPICDLADHHGSGTAHPFVCAIDLPQVFQLVVLMNSLFIAILTGIGVPLAPTFTLLKPPRRIPL